MIHPDLVVVCGIAFLAVFAVLSGLALIMRVLILLSPVADEPPPGGPARSVDPVIVTAITEGVRAACPGMRVTSIEETR